MDGRGVDGSRNGPHGHCYVGVGSGFESSGLTDFEIERVELTRCDLQRSEVDGSQFGFPWFYRGHGLSDSASYLLLRGPTKQRHDLLRLDQCNEDYIRRSDFLVPRLQCEVCFARERRMVMAIAHLCGQETSWK
ncbi:uncharacterized protein N7477_008204 [Penicillium maclennaniae]|uniref:uncharacterized protein n=1 Tax=Penicillium maclennaniae TaxID=1343394 RepID=UPI0025412358|nr:uncharacterized protein N7477_008204 [Penicillium maclennaniae]KAJ5665756.1 hypothetical protein N7477_008204 [Penicillium maclennaniae]